MVFNKLNYYALTTWILAPEEMTTSEALKIFNLIDIKPFEHQKGNKGGSRTAKIIDEAEVIRLYKEDRKPIQFIARKMQVGLCRVSKILKNDGCIKTRKGW